MIRTIDVEVMGQHHYLLYNNEASFQIREKFGDELMEKIGWESTEQTENTGEAFRILAEQGELARRYCGYPQMPFFDVGDIKYATPGEAAHMVNAIGAAVMMGLERQVPSLEDVDLGLLELEKKEPQGRADPVHRE